LLEDNLLTLPDMLIT